MRLIGYLQEGTPHIGRLTDAGIVPLTTVTAFWKDLPHWRAVAARAEGPTLPLASVQEAPAIWPGARILCVGLNYHAHAAEGGSTPPEYPAIFGRWARSLTVNNQPIAVLDDRLDWECELAAIVGQPTASVSPAEGKNAIFAYAAFNDISARTYQRHTHQWTPGKNMDRSGPISPLVTTDEAGDPDAGLAIQTRLNGQVMQSATTADMIHKVGDIVSYLSNIMTLCPGDVLVTGTCEGVGYARKPPLFLKAGDTIEVSVETVGTVRNTIVPAADRQP